MIVGDEVGDWAIWSGVEQSSKQIGIEHFGAHDLRRTCAKLCRKSGGDPEQIKFLLGHSSIQTTERSALLIWLQYPKMLTSLPTMKGKFISATRVACVSGR
jgi:integrase